MTKRIAVTGATSGIGRALVRAFRASGDEVLAIGRRSERLEVLAGETGCRTLASDVRDLATLTPALEDFAPDVLVNNAGVGHGLTGLADVSAEDIQEGADINIVAPIALTATVLPGMRARGSGHIVNIGSIAGLHTVNSALYGATKAAIHLFSQNLRNELAGSGIRVTEVCPGRTETEIFDASKGSREKLKAFGTPDIRMLKAEDIADAVLWAVGTPLHVNVATIEILPTDQAIGGAVLKRPEGG